VVGLVVVASMALARAADAREVWLNGVKLDPHVAVKSTRLSGCDVVIDEKGDVHIVAKGVRVEVAPVPPTVAASGTRTTTAAPPPAPAGAEAKLTSRYWMSAPQRSRGRVDYDIDVFVNETHVTRLRSEDTRVLVEITRHVKRGENRVRLVARKRAGATRGSASAADVMEIVVGSGRVGQGTVTIDEPLVTYRRNAAETKEFQDEYRFTGR
jgi:hypothetical protein